jgi:ABC-2 type transport system permease protein
MPKLFQTGWKLVFKRELRRMVSRPVYPIITIFIPLGFLLFFATLMPQGLPDRLPIGVIDHDQSSLSRKIIRQVDATQQAKITAHYLHYPEARAALQKGDIYGFVELPDGLQADVMNGMQPKIDFYYTQSYLIPGSLVLKDLSYLFTTISAGANLQTRQAKGQTTEESMGQILPISPEMHAIGNPWINYSVYLINVLLPGLLQLMVLLTCVYTIGIEMKKGSSPKWFRLSGQSIWKALFGKLLPYTIIFTVMGIFYDITLFKFMHYPMNNSIYWMFLNSFMLVVGAQCMGVFMVGLFPALRDGLSFSGLYGMLAFSYSGLSFPIDGMPAIMQGLSYIFPLRWFFKIYQGVALNGISPVHSLPSFLLMAAFVLFPLAIIKRLRTAMVELNFSNK